MNAATPAGADEAVALACDAFLREDAAAARTILAQGRRSHPLDSRFQVMSAALAQAEGRQRDALEHLWHGLSAEPASELCLTELVRVVVAARTDTPAPAKSFALESGERQTATTIDAIRPDHRARYAFAARWIRHRWARPSSCTGIDVFCGNGYGSRAVAEASGARMVGIDGSAPAVALATGHYGSHRVVFAHAIYPFTLNGPLFDFALSLESLEHVDDAAGLLAQMAAATDGPFVVSVPNERALPFARFGDRFEHHVRHFRREELIDLLAAVGRTRILVEQGQDVYALEGNRLAGLLPAGRMGLRAARPDSQFLIVIADMA